MTSNPGYHARNIDYDNFLDHTCSLFNKTVVAVSALPGAVMSKHNLSKHTNAS